MARHAGDTYELESARREVIIGRLPPTPNQLTPPKSEPNRTTAKGPVAPTKFEPNRTTAEGAVAVAPPGRGAIVERLFAQTPLDNGELPLPTRLP